MPNPGVAEPETVWWRTLLPQGLGLEEDVWHRRHRFLTLVLMGHVIVLYAFGVGMGFAPLHMAWEVGLLLAVAVAGNLRVLPRILQETAIALGLLASSALLVHLSGGYIEAHFHFFVMLPLVAMYQRWAPFLIAVLFVGIHHGIVGVLNPESVYNHPAAIAHPWTWAGIHAFFVGLECLTLFRLWREVEDRQVAAAAAQANATRLLAVQSVKERLLRVASHELSTPLTPIKLQLRLLEDPVVRDDATRHGQAMAVLGRNFGRLERIVGSVLDAVRVDNDAVRLALAPHDVARLAREAGAAYQDVAASRGLDLRIDTQRAMASVDGERIAQVLDNMVSNAIKYTPTGGRVEVRVRPDGHDVVFEVEDTGVGLNADQIGRLFQPFSMVHEGNDSAAGTGLGLYICKGIVEGHGGSMGADSRGPGQGSRFWARLPAHGHAPPSG
jgi:signal transduction histidine kinase